MELVNEIINKNISQWKYFNDSIVNESINWQDIEY